MYASALYIQCTKSEIVVDSGCSSHMCCDRDMFISIRAHSEIVKMGNGSEVMCREIGTVEIQMPNCIWELKNVLLIPQLTANFISVGRCDDSGCKTVFEGNVVTILKNDEVIGVGHKRDELYFLEYMKASTSGQKVNSINSEQSGFSLQEWHRRLGHLHNRAIVKMSNGLVNGLVIKGSLEEFKCEVCAKCKITEVPYPKHAQNRAGELLERVHSDLCEMPTPSYGGAKYFMTFTDDWSRYVSVYPLKAKSEAFNAWQRYRSVIENQTGKKVKILRSDNGREYVNNQFLDDLRRQGIVHETSVPHSPAQNGVAERQNRVLVEMVRCMLLEGDMPAAAWAEALLTAVYIRNRSSSSAVDFTPFELMHGRKPNMAHMQVFGDKVVALMKGRRVDKLEPKGQTLRFCGYAPTQKGYRLLCTNSGKLIISRDCIFLNRHDDNICIDGEVSHNNRSRKVEEVFQDAVDTPSLIERQVYDRDGKYDKCYKEVDTDEEL